MTYDRDTVVRGIERYYELLAKLAYIEGSEIIRPPPTGWTDEQLLMDMLVSAGRSDKVIDLVRHLPYLRCDRELEVYPPCRYVSYLREKADEDALSPETAKNYFHLQLMPFGDEIKTPANMVVLASDLNADAWVLDVDKGVIYQCDSTLYDEDAPEEEPWRQFGQRMDAKRFLDKVYGHVNNLILIPIPEPFPWFEGGNSAKGRVS